MLHVINLTMPRSYPVRSTRNTNVNYADYDLSYSPEAEYDSDYVPPTAEDFRQTARAARSAPAAATAPVTRTTITSSVRRSPRVRDNTSRTSTISTRSSTSQ